jgi:hypothetical protein
VIVFNGRDFVAAEGRELRRHQISEVFFQAFAFLLPGLVALSFGSFAWAFGGPIVAIPLAFFTTRKVRRAWREWNRKADQRIQLLVERVPPRRSRP